MPADLARAAAARGTCTRDAPARVTLPQIFADSVTGLLRWSPGVASAAWRHLTRTVPLYRTTQLGAPVETPILDPLFADDLDLQRPEHGIGPMFHRRYRTLVRDATLRPAQLIDELANDLNAAAPREVAIFVHGANSTCTSARTC